MTRSAGWPVLLLKLGVLLPAIAFSVSSRAIEAVDDQLEEVIVTARKVQENIQDIPMSVQVLSTEVLDELDLTSLFGLQFNIPGLVVHTTGMFGGGFTLRGVGSQGGSGVAVASHLDGVYLGRSNLALVRMFDLERVEVLKGPQGTLYGRNSTGGSINFITRAPQDDYSSEIEMAYGSFDTWRTEGHVNLPFAKAALRLAFIGSEGDGYIRNSIDDRTFGEADFWGLRAALRITVSDKWLIDLVAQHVTDDGASNEVWGPPPQFLVDPDDIRLTTVTLANPYLDTKGNNLSLNVEYDMGFAMLHSITGYADLDVHNLDDCSGRPDFKGCVRSIDPLDYHQWSQELQLASQGNGAWSWLIGAYYFHSDEFARFFNIIPLLNPLPRNNYSATSKDSAYAAFGQAVWQMADKWSLTGGLRLGHERSSASDMGTGTRDNPELTTASDDWSNSSWRLDIEYRPGSNRMLYASVSTGYKSGGVMTDLLPNGEFDTYQPESLIAYELGLNSQWLDHRLTFNGSAFYYDFSDMQISTSFFYQGQLVFDTENAAKAKIFGLDLTGEFQAGEHFSLSAGLVWMPEREFTGFESEWEEDNLSGSTIPRAPEWSASIAVNYMYPLGGMGKLSTRLEYNYRSSYFSGTDNDPLLAQDSFGLLNLYVSLEADSGKWRIFAIGRNLTDADYYNQIFLQSSPGYPATFEVGFSVRF